MSTLDILIPTYNRRKELLDNLQILDEYIARTGSTAFVWVVVSDNFSTDGTYNEACGFLDTCKMTLKIYHQDRNIGLEENAVFALSEAHAEYVMYLGDDDYLQFEYFQHVLRLIGSRTNFTCCVPSFVARTKDSRFLAARDLGTNESFAKGMYAVTRLFLKGHQLSGVAFLRRGTLDGYLSRPNLRNKYLFMYFVGFNCMRGRSEYVREFPVTVTLGQIKDWAYGKDGLSVDILKSIRCLLEGNPLRRTRLELSAFFSSAQSTRIIYRRNLQRLRAIFLTFRSRHLSILSKVIIVPLVPLYCFKVFLNRMFADLLS
ncbi:MAG: glycosyltransferase family 2 protein [Rhabdochlamydiaceae bacterium]